MRYAASWRRACARSDAEVGPPRKRSHRPAAASWVAVTGLEQEISGDVFSLEGSLLDGLARALDGGWSLEPASHDG
jgi:hypothetical protein